MQASRLPFAPIVLAGTLIDATRVHAAVPVKVTWCADPSCIAATVEAPGVAAQVPSSRRYLEVPGVAPGSGAMPEAWPVPEPTMRGAEGGATHVASSRKNLVVPATEPASGAIPEA